MKFIVGLRANFLLCCSSKNFVPKLVDSERHLYSARLKSWQSVGGKA